MNGFMNGFIDLTFEYGGRFYFADWKSNWLRLTPTPTRSNYIRRQFSGSRKTSRRWPRFLPKMMLNQI